MNPKHLSIRLAAALLLAGGLALLILFIGLPRQEVNGQPATIALKAPPFVRIASAQDVQSSGASFLEQEAGITAYTHAGQTINLADIRGLFKIIERETADYLIGSVSVPGYSDASLDVHVYAHREGWVAAYYFQQDSAPIARIFDCDSYRNGGFGNTFLTRVLTLVLNAAHVMPGSMNYYDFRYPNATRMMVVEDNTASPNPNPNSFQIQLPVEWTFYERSWSGSWLWGGDYCVLDGSTLSAMIAIPGGTCPTTKYGNLTFSQLLPGVFHTLTVQGSSTHYCAIILVYRETTQ